MNRSLHIVLTVVLFMLGAAFVFLAMPSDTIEKSRWQIGAWGLGALALAIAQVPYLIKKRLKRSEFSNHE